MAKYSREELEQALAAYNEARDRASRTGDWTIWADVFTEEAVSFIDRHKADPFFLMVAYTAPHSPLQAPEDIVERYESQGHSRGVAITYAMIEVMDRSDLMTKIASSWPERSATAHYSCGPMSPRNRTSSGPSMRQCRISASSKKILQRLPI